MSSLVLALLGIGLLFLAIGWPFMLWTVRAFIGFTALIFFGVAGFGLAFPEVADLWVYTLMTVVEWMIAFEE